MSTGNLIFQNFEEIEKRIKQELDLKNSKQLVEMIGIPQPTYSSRKKNNNFAAEWVVILTLKFNLNVRWILTGEGPKKTGAQTEKIKTDNSYLLQVTSWFEEITAQDPRKKTWFEVQFEETFPQFTEWVRSREGEKEKRKVA